MLQLEFENLTGCTLTPAEYRVFEERYMNCKPDKYQFAKRVLREVRKVTGFYNDHPFEEEIDRVGSTKYKKTLQHFKNLIEEIKSQIFSISYIMVKSISKTIPVKEICIFERKTKHQSGDGLLGGNYPFFTNEEETVKYFNTYDFDGEYIIANTGGKANFKYHNGKFTTMSDCLVIRFRNSLLTKFYSIVFSVLQKYIDYIGFEGSGLKHLNKDWFLKLQVPQCDENAEKFICIINDLKEKLQIEKDILSLYKKQKAYLLQNMFI